MEEVLDAARADDAEALAAAGLRPSLLRLHARAHPPRTRPRAAPAAGRGARRACRQQAHRQDAHEDVPAERRQLGLRRRLGACERDVSDCIMCLTTALVALFLYRWRVSGEPVPKFDNRRDWVYRSRAPPCNSAEAEQHGICRGAHHEEPSAIHGIPSVVFESRSDSIAPSFSRHCARESRPKSRGRRARARATWFLARRPRWSNRMTP